MKTLRLSFVALLLISLLTVGCDEPLCIKSEGPTVSQVIPVNGTFSKIELEGSCDMTISYGPNYSVEAVGSQNIIDRLITSLVGDELIVELEKHCYYNASLTVNVTLPYIEKATLDGSGDIVINDFIDQDDFEVNVIGSGDVVINEFTGTENLYVKIDGSGDVKANKNWPDLDVLDIRVSGSGDYAGYNLESNDCNVSISGSGSARVFANDNLDVIIDGSGDVYYKGNANVTQNISGSGDVINRN